MENKKTSAVFCAVSAISFFLLAMTHLADIVSTIGTWQYTTSIEIIMVLARNGVSVLLFALLGMFQLANRKKAVGIVAIICSVLYLIFLFFNTTNLVEMLGELEYYTSMIVYVVGSFVAVLVNIIDLLVFLFVGIASFRASRLQQLERGRGQGLLKAGFILAAVSFVIKMVLMMVYIIWGSSYFNITVLCYLLFMPVAILFLWLWQKTEDKGPQPYYASGYEQNVYEQNIYEQSQSAYPPLQ